MEPCRPSSRSSRLAAEQRRTGGFTLLEVGLTLLALALAGYIALAEARKFQHRAQRDRFVEELRALATAHMLPSMTDANHCYQNAIAERINGILKDEFNLDAVFPSFADAQYAVAESIHCYNTVRLHGSLNLQTPAQVFYHAAA